MRRPAVLAALGLVMGAITLAACSGSNFDPVEPAFAAEITGAVTRSALGVSAFGVVRDGGQTGFTFVMEDDGIRVIAEADRPLKEGTEFLTSWSRAILESVTEGFDISQPDGSMQVSFNVAGAVTTA